MRFSILVPEATVNYVENPSMRYDTTDWNAAGATITRTLEQARFGVASLKVMTNGTAFRQGTYYRVSELINVSDPITVSAYVRGTGRVRIRLINNPFGQEWASESVELRSDRWHRIWASGFSTGSDDLRLYVETDESTAVSRTFYVDGAQLERKSFPTTYCDGDQPGCRWTGQYHGSESSREAFTRAGGRWVQLAGEEREEENLYMTVAGGLGAAPITNHVKTFTRGKGGYLVGRKTEARVMTLTFHAKRAVSNQESAVSLAALHQLRQLLIDVVKPDRTGDSEDVWFEYEDGEKPIYFQARYDGGLEGDWDVRNQFVNSFPLRLLAVSPLMVEDNQEVMVLDFQNQRPAIRRVIGRINGEWNHLNFGMNGAVSDLELGPGGEVFACGAFTLVNFSAEAIDPFRVAVRIAYWDGEKWIGFAASAVSTGMNDVAIAPNGYIYIAGAFSQIDGVPANNVAYWDGNNWNAMGTGLNSDGVHISIDAAGNVYVGGHFTTAGGVTAGRIAKWDGSQWHALGQYSGLNNSVLSIAISPDGDFLYCAGRFTDERLGPGLDLNHVARYDVDTDRFSPVGFGLDATVEVSEVLLHPFTGDLYACGDFLTSGATILNHIGVFRGGVWLPLGGGMDDEVLSFDIGPNGDIVAVGHFDMADEVPTKGIALWNGSAWTNMDIEINEGDTNVIPLAVQYLPNGNIFFGGSWAATFRTLYSGINLVTNPGTAEVSPVIYISGSGRLKWIENQTTKKRLFFDLLIIESEEVFLDFARGVVVSTVRGDLFHAMLPGSDFHAFTLVPGENKLACFMTNDVNAQMSIQFTPTHWGVDATAPLP